MSPILQPLIEQIAEYAVLAASAALTAGITAGVAYLRLHVKALQSQAASAALDTASNQLQAATQNAAGDMVHDIQTGKLNLSSPGNVKSYAEGLASKVVMKIPEAVATVAPMSGVISDMITQKAKLALAAAPAPATTVVPGSTGHFVDPDKAHAIGVQAHMDALGFAPGKPLSGG